ncbi:MAG: SAM-dependent methyltransferase [Bacteroidales bacterium]|nr:MAG: SAM-dependent methyltransferase [Bacteroidales bacterium]
MATLYLIPTTLGEGDLDSVLPSNNVNIIKQLSYFIVENIRSARRFLKKVDRSIDIDSLHFSELNRHTNMATITSFVEPLKKGFDVGIVSEAGCPAIADPGADIVGLAQNMGVKVVPLVGPSSILLSLMASGFNGQSFAFEGYLPIDKQARVQRIKQLERRISSEHQTQIFIETPYRNNQLLQDLISTLNPKTKICVASQLTTAEEMIKTMSVVEWKKNKIDIHKKPTIFLIYQ